MRLWLYKNNNKLDQFPLYSVQLRIVNFKEDWHSNRLIIWLSEK